MKTVFELVEKSFKANKDQDGNELQEEREIKYYVLEKTLIDGTKLQVPIKGDKAKLLLLSLSVENRK